MLIGLSGGIDSSLTAAVAAPASDGAGTAEVGSMAGVEAVADAAAAGSAEGAGVSLATAGARTI